MSYQDIHVAELGELLNQDDLALLDASADPRALNDDKHHAPPVKPNTPAAQQDQGGLMQLTL